jgi:hypothetical protein
VSPTAPGRHYPILLIIPGDVNDPARVHDPLSGHHGEMHGGTIVADVP